MALLYVVLGAAGSGRREVLADLIESLREESPAPIRVCLSVRESLAPMETGLEDRPGVTVHRWPFLEPVSAEQWPSVGDAATVFLVADGRANPVDQIEQLPAWIRREGLELGRIYTVVHCALAEQHPEVAEWYDACIHFSDLVLLNRREGVNNRWMREFQERYRKLCFPCLFEFVKAGRVGNPAQVLFPEARRLSQFFEETELPPEEFPADETLEIGDEPVLAEAADGEESEEAIPPDPYLERLSNGARAKPVPDIARFLP